MSSTEPHEIVIIRRRHGHDEEGHHGGVWKIAFADFMTAMMAFFLVMWLISASDKNRAAIARYFNPMQLVDTTTQPFGLDDPSKDASGVKGQGTSKTALPPKGNAEPPKGSGERPKGSGETPSQGEKSPTLNEAALFQDPYAALAKIAGEVQTGSHQALPGVAGATSRGKALNPGDAFRDPFAPVSPPPSPETAEPEEQADAPADPPASAAPAPKAEVQPPAPAAHPPASAAQAGKPSQTGASAAAELRAQIDKLVAQASPSQPAPKIDVQSTDEGLLISLTDDANFSMFATGSAQPERKVVQMMEKIALLLKTRPGKIVLRGHTDSRPYKSASYDNWRLSSARAHMAHYMLVRGGLDEQRIERIEGYADRRLKLPNSPDAPENRRIEVLLLQGKP